MKDCQSLQNIADDIQPQVKYIYEPIISLHHTSMVYILRYNPYDACLGVLKSMIVHPGYTISCYGYDTLVDRIY